MNTPWFRDSPLDLSRPETKEAVDVVADAYDERADLVMLAQSAGLKKSALRLDAGTARNFAWHVLQKAHAAGRLLRLLAEVLNDREKMEYAQRLGPLVAGHEAELAAAILQHRPSVGLLAAAPPSGQLRAGSQPPVPLAGFERTINKAAGTTDPARHRREMLYAELRTARISVGGKVQGTGFLVGDRLLLTAWHVVSGIGGNLRGVAQFDYKRDATGFEHAGRPVDFAELWLVAHSEHRPVAEELGADGPAAGCWDYALVRLAADVAKETVGPDAASVGAPRGCYRLDGAGYAFDASEPILIMGHPKKQPIQLAYASPAGATLTNHATRVRYQTNTEAGSSGSPVFNKDWRVVALHHATGPTSESGTLVVPDGAFNQGIPIADIIADLAPKVDPSVRHELGLP